MRYEQLANPNPGKAVKTKTVPIAQTLSDLAQFLRDERDRLVNQPEVPPLAIQQTFQTALANIEASKAQIDERLKETHASGTKIGKLIDKKTPVLLPEHEPLFQSTDAVEAIKRTIGQHLIRTGALQAANVFAEETATELDSAEIAKFAELRKVVGALRVHDVEPALSWVEANRGFLEAQGSDLEFLLHRSQYLRILSESPIPTDIAPAFEYAKQHLLPLEPRYPSEVPKLMNCLVLGDSVSRIYPDLASPEVHNRLEGAFSREYCASRHVSNQAPLKVVSIIGGGIALPRIEKGKKIMKERKGEWSHTEEIPVEIPLPPENHYHSVFTCPVSKEQATVVNPPMMLQCGHVIVRESLQKLTKVHTRVKCPYCPRESDARQAVRLYF